MPTRHEPNVAVSYSWKEEREGANKGAVHAFCEQLKIAGATVVRDVDRVKHGECLSTFMRSIGISGFLCVFLSDAYLKSPNCMYELLIAWQRSKDNPDEFRQRVKVWVMPGSVSIHSVENRLQYTDYWQLEHDRVVPLIKKHAVGGLAASEFEQFRRIKQFAEHVNEMLVFFSDTLSPDSDGEFQKWIADQIPIMPEAIGEAALAAAYENTLNEIEEALNEHSVVCEFLERVTTGVLQKNGSNWKLSEQSRSHTFSVVKTLEQISKKISTFKGTPDDWSVLGDLVGGFAVLGINREWVVRQRQAARSASAEYPADDHTMRLGNDRHASLLHLVSSALADGRARLENVFGKPPLDEHQVPEVPQVLPGTKAEDRNHAIKLHFICYILGKDEPINAGDKKRVEIQFKRAKDLITSAFHDDHTPFVAAGASYKEQALVDTIRNELKIEDLLLIHPSGDDPEALLQDNVRVLKFLGNIFDAVSAKTRK